MRERSVEGIASGQVNRGFIQVVLQDDEPAKGSSLPSKKYAVDDTHPVSMMEALPRMDWKLANESVPETKPPGTFQSRRHVQFQEAPEGGGSDHWCRIDPQTGSGSRGWGPGPSPEE